MHVLTGPDHLSALATISANAQNCQSFWYGVRWGIGHSIGLIVVGSILIFLSAESGDVDDNRAIVIPEWIESLCETFVGIFMLILGSYSLVKAYRKRKGGKSDYYGNSHEERRHSMVGNYEKYDSTNDLSQPPGLSSGRSRRQAVMNTESSDRSIVSISHQEVSGSTPRKLRPSIFENENNVTPPIPLQLGEASLSLADAPDSFSAKPMNVDYEESLGLPTVFRHEHGHEVHEHVFQSNSKDTGFSKKFLSICIGIVHGVAGPGGVLGVIPAVQLQNLWLSIVYLGSFCVTSTLVMGSYAAAYGMCSSRFSRHSESFAYRIEIFSASLSIFVGSLWLTLLSMGILHDIFP